MVDGITIWNVYFTLVAIHVLREEFAGERDQWRCIVKKAKAFMRHIGLKESDRLLRAFTIKTKVPPAPQVVYRKMKTNLEDRM